MTISEPSDFSPFTRLGGEPAVRQLVDHFYDEMASNPVATKVRGMHQPDLAEAREKLFLFLCGWLGGPQLYVQKHGHPMLRARHMPFAIDRRARDEWLYCMFQALGKMNLSADLQDELEQSFWRTADFMRNQNEDAAVDE